MSVDRVSLAAAVAYAALLPLASLVVTADAAHPQLAGLLPPAAGRAGAALFLALVLWIAAREVIARRPLSPMYRAGLIFAAAALLGSALGFEPLPGIIGAAGFAALALAGNATLRVAGGGAWRPVLIAFVWSGIFFCAIALIALALRRPAALYAFTHGRAIGIFENPNELAEFALAVCAAGIGMILGGVGPRRLAWSALALGSLTVAASASRSGVIAYAIGALVLLAGLRPRRAIALVVLAVALIGVGIAFTFDRRHNPAENDSRLAAWRAGIATVALFPLTGAGIGAYYRVYPFVRPPDAPGPDDPIAYDPHNFYLSVAAETGLLGLAALGYTIVTFLAELREALAGASIPARRLGIALAAGLAAVACHLIFNGFALSIALWALLAALAVGAARSGYGRVV